MKYNTKRYHYSNDEPNINNNSTISSAYEKRLLLKNSNSIKQSNPYQRDEQRLGGALSLNTTGGFAMPMAAASSVNQSTGSIAMPLAAASSVNQSMDPRGNKQIDALVYKTNTALKNLGSSGPFPPMLYTGEIIGDNPDNNEITISTYSLKNGYCGTTLDLPTTSRISTLRHSAESMMDHCNKRNNCIGIRVSKDTKNYTDIVYELIKQPPPGTPQCENATMGKDHAAMVKKFTAYKQRGTIGGRDFTGLSQQARNSMIKTQEWGYSRWKDRKARGLLLGNSHLLMEDTIKAPDLPEGVGYAGVWKEPEMEQPPDYDAPPIAAKGVQDVGYAVAVGPGVGKSGCPSWCEKELCGEKMNLHDDNWYKTYETLMFRDDGHRSRFLNIADVKDGNIWNWNEDIELKHIIVETHNKLKSRIRGNLKSSTKDEVRLVYIRMLQAAIAKDILQNLQKGHKGINKEIRQFAKSKNKNGKDDLIIEAQVGAGHLLDDLKLKIGLLEALKLEGQYKNTNSSEHFIDPYSTKPFNILLDQFIQGLPTYFNRIYNQYYEEYHNTLPEDEGGRSAALYAKKKEEMAEADKKLLLAADAAKATAIIKAGRANKGLGDGGGMTDAHIKAFTGNAEGAGRAVESNNLTPVFFGLPNLENTMFIKHILKKLITAFIKDEKIPPEIIDIIEKQARAVASERGMWADLTGRGVVMEMNSIFNNGLKETFGENAPQFYIYDSKISEIFPIINLVYNDERANKEREAFDTIISYITLHMEGESDWFVEQFIELQKSRYKNSRVVRFAVQFINKLANTTGQSTESTNGSGVSIPLQYTLPSGETVPINSATITELTGEIDRLSTDLANEVAKVDEYTLPSGETVPINSATITELTGEIDRLSTDLANKVANVDIYTLPSGESVPINGLTIKTLSEKIDTVSTDLTKIIKKQRTDLLEALAKADTLSADLVIKTAKVHSLSYNLDNEVAKVDSLTTDLANEVARVDEYTMEDGEVVEVTIKTIKELGDEINKLTEDLAGIDEESIREDERETFKDEKEILETQIRQLKNGKKDSAILQKDVDTKGKIIMYGGISAGVIILILIIIMMIK